MDTQHLNTYLQLIEALLHCPKGKEWYLLQQHEDLIDAKLLTVMEQVSNQLQTEGNVAAAKFLNYWASQLTNLLQQQAISETPEESRSGNYLKLVQTLLSCSKGDEVEVLSQHPELVDEGLVYAMNQVAAQLAAQGNQDVAIYLKHLAAEVNRIWLHPDTEKKPENISTPSTLSPVLPVSSPAVDSHIDKHVPNNDHNKESLAKILQRLEVIEELLNKFSISALSNPLWYMPILEQVNTQAWIISSEEIEQLIGVKPSCAPGHSSFLRGCWKFVKIGKVGTQSAWRVIKEEISLPIDTPAMPDSITERQVTKPDLDLSSPWSEAS